MAFPSQVAEFKNIFILRNGLSDEACHELVERVPVLPTFIELPLH